MNTDIEFFYIGWCYHPSDLGTSNDKVWTAFKVGGAHYAGWGARGKAMRFKKHPTYESLMKVKRSKEDHYDEVDAFKLFAIFPDFEKTVSEKLLMATLTNSVM